MLIRDREALSGARRAIFAVALVVLALPGAVAQRGPYAPDTEENDIREIPVGVDRLLPPRWRLADGPHVRMAFREVVREASQATVRVWSNGRHVAMGGVVAAEGLIVTKASSLDKKLKCQWADGAEHDAKVVATDAKYDLALLRVNARHLPTLELTSESEPDVGSFLATVGPDDEALAVGVVSVAARQIPPRAGVLGVQLDEGTQPIVVKVFPDSGALRAGVKEGDLILSVAGNPVATRIELIREIRNFHPGSRVALEVSRDGETIDLSAVLTASYAVLPRSRSEFQNDLGGQLSLRRFGFPRAFQHDTVLEPRECGGPVVDLDGRVVGFNIARSGRTESYAVSNAAVQQLLEKIE